MDGRKRGGWGEKERKEEREEKGGERERELVKK
jgi:hypothetical protein